MDKSVMRKVSYKRILQVLLFALFPIVDFCRTSTNAWQMMLAAQLVGLVLNGIMVLHYGIKRFLKWYNLLWIVASGIAIGTMPFWFYEEAIKYHYLYETWFAFVNVAVLGMILTQVLIDVFKRNKDFSVKKKNKGGVLLFILWFSYILLATLMKDNSFRPEFDLIYFGIFYFVSFTKEELKELFDDLLDGILLGFSVLQLIAFFFRPYVDGFMRYRGMYYNSNLFDLICLLMVIVILFKMTRVRRNKIRRRDYILWSLYYGMVFSMIVFSLGRVSMALAIGITILYGCIIFVIEKQSWKKLIPKAGLLFVAVCVALPLTFFMSSYLPRVFEKPIIHPGEEVLLGDLDQEDNYVSVDELLEGLVGRFSRLLKYNIEEAEEVKTEPEDLEPLDPDWEHKTYYLTTKHYSGVEIRLAIWRTYADQLNMNGHIGEQWELWVSPYFKASHPHNVFLMQLFMYGIPSGLLFIAWSISYLYLAFRYMLKEKEQLYFAFAFLVVLLLFGFGTFDTCWMNGQMSWVLLMFMQKFLLSNEKLLALGEENGKN